MISVSSSFFQMGKWWLGEVKRPACVWKAHRESWDRLLLGSPSSHAASCDPFSPSHLLVSPIPTCSLWSATPLFFSSFLNLFTHFMTLHRFHFSAWRSGCAGLPLIPAPDSCAAQSQSLDPPKHVWSFLASFHAASFPCGVLPIAVAAGTVFPRALCPWRTRLTLSVWGSSRGTGTWDVCTKYLFSGLKTIHESFKANSNATYFMQLSVSSLTGRDPFLPPAPEAAPLTCCYAPISTYAAKLRVALTWLCALSVCLLSFPH